MRFSDNFSRAFQFQALNVSENENNSKCFKNILTNQARSYL